MLFNSLEFLIFLPTVFFFYWFVFQKNLRVQNLLLLLSSYVFYGWWDYRFLFLIFLSTVVDYVVGLKIHYNNDIKKKKSYLWLSILFNLGLLGFFKYFNFFIDSWIDLLGTIGYEQKSIWTLNVILPVGISFYTFQTMSYSLDIYNGKLKPTKDFISFASFVSFFPQLVAGPIERASNLLPQILNNRVFKYKQGILGLRLIFYGMFKKVVIADSLSPMVSDIFTNFQDYGATTLWLGCIYFSFQIYCDFSGYSDIAVGTSKLFGFELMSNFKFPYFSRNIGEFWRRWHISLSTWFRDYLYIPLGGSKGDKWLSIRNIFIIFIVSGFWHGANWNFIFWGVFHAMLFLPSFIFKTNRKFTITTIGDGRLFPTFKEIFHTLTTFILISIGWVFFRSETTFDAVLYIKGLTSFNDIIHHNPYNYTASYKYLFSIFLFLIIEYFQTKNISLSRFQSCFFLIVLVLIILFFMPINLNNDFIYFQF